MPFRVRKSVKIAPGVRMNISKSGISTSTKVLPGVYYTNKVVDLKDKKKTQNKSSGNVTSKEIGEIQSVAPAKKKKPVPLRWWYIAFAVFWAAVGISMLQDGDEAGTLGIVICGVMLIFTVVRIVRRNKEKEIEEAESEGVNSGIE